MSYCQDTIRWHVCEMPEPLQTYAHRCLYMVNTIFMFKAMSYKYINLNFLPISYILPLKFLSEMILRFEESLSTICDFLPTIINYFNLIINILVGLVGKEVLTKRSMYNLKLHYLIVYNFKFFICV